MVTQVRRLAYSRGRSGEVPVDTDSLDADHEGVTSARTRLWVLGVSVLAGPVIGIPAFAVVAAVFRADLAWLLGLTALLCVPATCCYLLGRRVGSPELGNGAAVVAVLSSVLTTVAVLLVAISRASFAQG
jgi:hypothetical protein